MEDKIATVYISGELKVLNVNYALNSPIEDLCIEVCKHLEIGPLAMNLFAIRNFKKKNWYPPNHILDGKEDKFEFRLRYKPSTWYRLKDIDSKAYDYYFEQVRQDVIENNVLEIIFEKHKAELLGLGVCDMYRVMLENQITRKDVLKDYKKYVPKECIKKHSIFVKKPIRNTLKGLSGYDAPYIKDQYLRQFESMAPNYPCEDHQALLQKKFFIMYTVTLRLFSEKVDFCEEDGKWDTLFFIKNLAYISTRSDGLIEICRKEKTPIYLQFSSKPLLLSFVSALDGYYRLSVNFISNMCYGIETPSLIKQKKMGCHGPIGGLFTFAKLWQRTRNSFGSFTIRESEKFYNVFYIDTYNKHGAPRSYRMNQLGPKEYCLVETNQKFRTLGELLKLCEDPEGKIHLNDYILPTEKEFSPLLLCVEEKWIPDKFAEPELVEEVLNRRATIIYNSELLVFRGKPFPEYRGASDVELARGTILSTTVYRAFWRIVKGKKVEVALKILNNDKFDPYYMESVGPWSQLKSEDIVRVFGVLLHPTQGIASEYLKMGPLDAYLRKEKQIVKVADLLEASLNLANAVRYLRDKKVVHGNLRCRKLLVHEHSDQHFTVKLSEPGSFKYGGSDIHWLPTECYDNPESAKVSFEADIWAMGTVIWEIFFRGGILPLKPSVDVIKKYYASGKRLPLPKNCPAEIYPVMLDCWEEEKKARNLDVIARNLSHLYISAHGARDHDYATIEPKSFKNSRQESDKPAEIDSLDAESRASDILTNLKDADEDESDYLNSTTDDDFNTFLEFLIRSNIKVNAKAPDNSEGNVRLVHMLDIFELRSDCNIILQGIIGQGHYGEVYQGLLEEELCEESEPRKIAIKKLKVKSGEADLIDFEREISIMKTLKHPNIVEILAVITEPDFCLIMEFFKHGSLRHYLIMNQDALNAKRLLHFALDIATGMDYLGHKSIVHRDLAARNILVADENHVKISDFGLAQVMDKNNYYIIQTNRELPIKWYAPESLREGKFSAKSDVWSFGVTMFEMFSFGDDPELLAKPDSTNKLSDQPEEPQSIALLNTLERGIRLPCPTKCSVEIYTKLMTPCWAWDSHNRPKFSTLCNEIKDLIADS